MSQVNVGYAGDPRVCNPAQLAAYKWLLHWLFDDGPVRPEPTIAAPIVSTIPAAGHSVQERRRRATAAPARAGKEVKQAKKQPQTSDHLARTAIAKEGNRDHEP